MPKNVMCKKCNNLINGWCEKKIDSPDPNMVRDCQYFWEKTNADRIRAMSDEKMVPMFMDMTINGVRPWCDFHCRKDGKYGCEKCILKWLQQTAEDE